MRFQTSGPMPVSRYMTLCLQHPTLGYYTTRTVFGKEGDFITSPEISQVFGEVRSPSVLGRTSSKECTTAVRPVCDRC